MHGPVLGCLDQILRSGVQIGKSLEVNEWCLRAGQLAGRTAFTTGQWMVLLTAFPDITDREVHAAWRVWCEAPEECWGRFAAYLAVAVDIRKERTHEHIGHSI